MEQSAEKKRLCYICIHYNQPKCLVSGNFVARKLSCPIEKFQPKLKKEGSK
jgi:hypothetical protein